MKTVVELRSEHDVADVVQQDNTEQHTPFIDYREDISSTFGNHFHHIAQCHLRRNDLKLLLDDAVHAEQGQDSLVLVVGQQFALLRQTHGVDAVGLEHQDGDVGADRDDHQRQEEVISTRQLGNQEDTGQGGVHDTGHDTGHTQEGKVLLRAVHREGKIVGGMGKYESGDTTQVQAGCKNTTTPATGIGRTGGEDLGQQDEREEHDHTPIGVVQVVEETLVHDVGVLPIQQGPNGIVPFAI